MASSSSGGLRRGVASVAAVVLLSAGVVWVGATGAVAAEPPSTAVTIAGQSLRIDITDPATPTARVEAPSVLTVRGTARIGEPQPDVLNAAFVVDVSNSTETGTYDCNGDGVLDGRDDFNGAGSAIGRIIDCEIAGVLAINESLVDRTNTNTALLAFAQRPGLADMQADAGTQAFTPAGHDSAGPLPGDVETVARSLRTNGGSGSIGQYSSVTGLGSSTGYRDAVSLLASTLGAAPAGEERVAFFFSDGTPSDGFQTGSASETAALVSAGIKVNTFAVGALAGGCATTMPLGFLASSTGGTCTSVADPGALTAVIAQAATIAAVEYSLDGAAFAPVGAYDPAAGTFSVQVPVTLGSHTLRVRVRASDGTVAQDSVTITGIDAPDVAPASFSVAEGMPLAVPAGATDLDTPRADLTYAWSPADGRLSATDAESPTFTSDDDGVFAYAVTVTDADGLSATATKTITVTNVAPAVSSIALSPVVNEGEPTEATVTFADPGSDDSHTVRFEWGDGSQTTMALDERSRTHTVSASHTYPAGSPDTVLRVIVTDDDGGSGFGEQLVDINHGPGAALDRDAYQVTEGSALAIGASYADPDGDALTATLSALGRSSGGVLDGSGTLGLVIGPDLTVDDGTHVVSAHVEDPHGLIGGDTATLTVLNAPPVITGLDVPTHVLPGSYFSISGDLTDPGVADTHTVSVSWSDGSTAPASVTGGGGSAAFTATHSFATYGTYVGTVRTCDDDGGCASQQLVIAVGTPPIADAGPDHSVAEGSRIALPGAAHDPDAADGQRLSVSWDPDDGHLTEADTLSPTFHAVDEGTFGYTLTVCDDLGVCAFDDVTIVVINVAPTIDALTATEDTATQTVQLRVEWSDPGNLDDFTGTIHWGDGVADAFSAGTGERSLVRSHAYGTSGSYSIRVQLADDALDFDVATTAIDVVLNRAPSVDAGGSYVVPEGGTLRLAGTATDPEGADLAVGWSPTSLFSSGGSSLQPTFNAAGLDGSSAGTPHTVRLWADDGLPHGWAETSAEVRVFNVAPRITSLTGPNGPVPVGSTATIDVAFFDPSPTDVHTVRFQWADGAVQTVSVLDGSGRATATRGASDAGVSTVTVSVADSDGAVTAATFEYVVAYDPTAGFVTGAGSISSPPGAYPDEPLATGKATFGLLSRYQKGATVPTGDTQFQFKGVGLSFESTAYEYLVVSGTKATYRGVGTVNGAGSYGFEVTVIDGTKGNPDRFRIRIWDHNRGNASLYDNELGTPGSGDPTTQIATGSIVIHKG